MIFLRKTKNWNDPLEQFSNGNVQTTQYNCITLLSNSTLSLMTASFILFTLISYCLTNKYKNNLALAGYNATENFIKMMSKDTSRTIKKAHLQSFLFLFVTVSVINITGLIPYSWTVTSWFTSVFLIALSFFFQINILIILGKKFEFFSQFIPAGTPLVIIPFLNNIEIISYTSRVISLSVRLFANMLSGHALLKILISFAWSLLKTATILGLVIAFII